MHTSAIVILLYFPHSNKRISTEKMPDKKTWRHWKSSRKTPLTDLSSFAEAAGFSEWKRLRGFTG